MSFKRRGIISLLLLLILFVGFISVISSGVSVETNILKLIPDSESSLLSEKVETFSESQTGEMVFLLSHRNDDTLVHLAQLFEEELKKSGLYSSVEGFVSDEEQAKWYKTYFRYRYSLLSNQLRKQLQSDMPGKRLLRHLQRELYSATPDYYGETLNEDPLFLFPSYMKSLFSTEIFDTYRGYPLVRSDSVSSTIISASLQGSPFSLDIQTEVEGLIRQWEEKLSSRGGIFNSTGIVRFAAAAFFEAKREISLIGIVSLMGVLVILLLTFRSLRLLVIGSLPIITGILTGFTITALLFPSIHIIALTMGASLTGIAIDYSLHYLTHLRFSLTDGSSVLKQVFPGITLGAVTTLIGYGVLGFGGFPGFQQIALFTGSGLLASYLTVVLIFPILLSRYKKKQLLRLPFFQRSSRFHNMLLLPLVAIVIVGLFHIKTNDDIFDMRTPMPELDLEEAKIREFSAGIEGSRFVVVSGENSELLLQNLEEASLKLDTLITQKALGGYVSISRFVVSQKRAHENIFLLKRAINDNSNLKNEMSALGFDSEVYENIELELASPQILTLEDWLHSQISQPWRRLIHVDNGDCFSIILLKNVSDENALSGSFKEPDIQYINKVAEVSETLGIYRYEATMLVCWAYLIILVILMIRYGTKQGVLIFLPPVLSGGVALVIPGFFGQSITFMHIMALLLVLGIGIDYTIFFAEGSSHRKETLLAVMLSALSTVLAFGVLGLSSTPALKAIGGVITPGIIFSFLLAPLLVKPRK